MGASDAKLVDNLSMSYMVDYPLKLWVRPTEKPRIGKIRCGDYPLKHWMRPTSKTRYQRDTEVGYPLTHRVRPTENSVAQCY